MTRRRSTASGAAARLGLFAVLFQAILFGWHHHDLTLAGRQTVPLVANPTAPPQALDDEDGCEICQVLHHLTAAPVEPAGASPPLAVAMPAASVETAVAASGRTLSFRARAPPLA